jgi:hypothetical protein
MLISDRVEAVHRHIGFGLGTYRSPVSLELIRHPMSRRSSYAHRYIRLLKRVVGVLVVRIVTPPFACQAMEVSHLLFNLPHFLDPTLVQLEIGLGTPDRRALRDRSVLV